MADFCRARSCQLKTRLCSSYELLVVHHTAACWLSQLKILSILSNISHSTTSSSCLSLISLLTATSWSEFSKNKPFSPWFQFPHALRPLLLCGSCASSWQRQQASSQLVVWFEPEKTGINHVSNVRVYHQSPPEFSLTVCIHAKWLCLHRPQQATWKRVVGVHLASLLTLLYLAFGCKLLSTASTHSCSLDESM